MENKDFKLSRSRFDEFMSCPRCFYLKVNKGFMSPSTPGWTLNTLTDTLLKKEFDEKQFLSTELASIGKKEFGVEIQVFGATDEDIYDPKGKARHARPFKPAILIE